MSNSIAPGSSADVNVRVTALTTNPNVPVTYKTIILKKNLVNGVNTLTQEMMSAQNTKYVIKYDFTLGEDITVPENCVLEFDGGSLSGNYTITGNNTGINADLVKIFNTDITLDGTWNVSKSYSVWFGDDDKSVAMACSVSDNIELTNKTYTLPSSVSLTERHICINGNGCNITRNGAFDIITSNGGSLHLANINFDGDNTANGIIYVVDSENVKVESCSFVKAGTPQITGLYVNNAYDGICVLNSKQVTIDNCLFDTIERTGCQCNGVNYLYITNSRFYRCGNEAATNDGSMSATTRFVFETVYLNNIASDCYGGGFSVESVGTATQGDIEDYNRIIDKPSDYNVKSKFIVKSNTIYNCGLNFPQGKDYLHAILAGQYVDAEICDNTIKSWNAERNGTLVDVPSIYAFSTCSYIISRNNMSDIKSSSIVINNAKLPESDTDRSIITANRIVGNNDGIVINNNNTTKDFIISDNTIILETTDTNKSAIKVNNNNGVIRNNVLQSVNENGYGIYLLDGSVVDIIGNDYFIKHFAEDIHFDTFTNNQRRKISINNNSFISNNLVRWTYGAGYGVKFEIKKPVPREFGIIELWYPEYDANYLPSLKDLSFINGDIMHIISDGSTYRHDGSAWVEI